MKIQQINLAYILGLIEADGGILLMFGTGKSKTTLKPLIRISQKSNPNLLTLCKDWFENHGIECNYEDWNPNTSKGRARNLTIKKVGSVRLFIELVKKEPFQFISQKQRDFWILDRVLNTPQTLSLSDKINLRKSMHKANMDQPDLNPKDAKTREQLELQYGVALGSSREDALGILKKIDAQYLEHTTRIQKLIADKTLTLPAEWLAGLIDGDGAYYVTMQVREPSDRYNKQYIEFQADFTLSMETNSLLTIQAVKSVIGSESEIKESKSHYQLWVRNQGEVKKLLELQSGYTPVGSHRLTQYNLVRTVLDYKEKKMMRDLNTVLSVIRASYAISEKSKGRERTVPLEKMEEIARSIYG